MERWTALRLGRVQNPEAPVTLSSAEHLVQPALSCQGAGAHPFCSGRQQVPGPLGTALPGMGFVDVMNSSP